MALIDPFIIRDAPTVHTGASWHRPFKPARSWREFFRPRLLGVAALAAFALFIYVLMSFHGPLKPAFTTTEVVLALILLGLVISRV